MKRALFLLHRYFGIALCLLMAAWCLSGIVMMYVPFPTLTTSQRLAGLAPLNFDGCCEFDQARAAVGDSAIDNFSVEMLADRPVLRLGTLEVEATVDLRSGAFLDEVSSSLAREVAATYVANSGLGESPRLLRALERDQWTVSGDFNNYRPLYQFSLNDAVGTEIYVSGVAGKVVQQTTARQRFWNYFGAVTHWLYPTTLRQHAAAWHQTVVWSSIAGMFLVVIGITIGWMQWQRGSHGYSPYRGWLLWHHLSGLIFGVLALTWLGSGLISMNPWGFLEGGASAPERAHLAGLQLRGAQAIDVAQALRDVSRAGSALAEVKQITSAPFDGQLYIMARASSGARRLDAQLTSAPMDEPSLRAIAGKVQPAEPLLDAGLIAVPDRYYYAHHSDPPFPVYRVLLGDTQATRYYIDPANGELLRKIDRNGRWWRWLFSALHQWDFAAPLRQRPVWDMVVVGLLLGLSVLSLSGVWLGFRSVKRSL